LPPVQGLTVYVGAEVHLQSFVGSTPEGNETLLRVTTDLSPEGLPLGSNWLRGTAGPDDLKKRKTPCPLVMFHPSPPNKKKYISVACL
jgi:hypothetical protein